MADILVRHLMKPYLRANWARVGQVSLPATLMIDHFADVGKLIEAGKGAKREIEDILQSAMNRGAPTSVGDLIGGADIPVRHKQIPEFLLNRVSIKAGGTSAPLNK